MARMSAPPAPVSHLKSITDRLERANAELGEHGVDVSELLPQIMLLGNQSAGKSTLIQALTGLPMPNGSGTTTRLPVCIQERVREPDSTNPVFSVAYVCPKNGTTEVAVAERDPVEVDRAIKSLSTTLKDIQDKVVGSQGVSSTVVTIRWEKAPAESVANWTIYDFPGVVVTPPSGELNSFPGAVRGLISQFAANPRALLVTVIQHSDSNVLTVPAVSLAMELDPTGERTIVVSTKQDCNEEPDEFAHKMKSLVRGGSRAGADQMKCMAAFAVAAHHYLHIKKKRSNSMPVKPKEELGLELAEGLAEDEDVAKVFRRKQKFFNKWTPLIQEFSKDLGVKALKDFLVRYFTDAMTNVFNPFREELQKRSKEVESRLETDFKGIPDVNDAGARDSALTALNGVLYKVLKAARLNAADTEKFRQLNKQFAKGLGKAIGGEDEHNFLKIKEELERIALYDPHVPLLVEEAPKIYYSLLREASATRADACKEEVLKYVEELYAHTVYKLEAAVETIVSNSIEYQGNNRRAFISSVQTAIRNLAESRLAHARTILNGLINGLRKLNAISRIPAKPFDGLETLAIDAKERLRVYLTTYLGGDFSIDQHFLGNLAQVIESSGEGPKNLDYRLCSINKAKYGALLAKVVSAYGNIAAADSSFYSYDVENPESMRRLVDEVWARLDDVSAETSNGASSSADSEATLTQELLCVEICERFLTSLEGMRKNRVDSFVTLIPDFCYGTIMTADDSLEDQVDAMRENLCDQSLCTAKDMDYVSLMYDAGQVEEKKQLVTQLKSYKKALDILSARG